MNKKLAELYKSVYGEFMNLSEDMQSRISFPYLISPSEEYQKADFKIMFCGKDTNGWGGELSDNINGIPKDAETMITELMELYQRKCYKDEVYREPYWQFVKGIMQQTDELLDKKQIPKKIGFVSNNIVKIGRIDSAGSYDDVNRWTKKNFNVWKNEFEILDPDIILFFTGPNYDDIIQMFLGNFTQTEFERTIPIYKLNFYDSSIPSFKTFHPRSLQGQGQKQPCLDFFSNLIIKTIEGNQ